MANGLLAKNGIIVTGSIEVQNAVTASAFSGDGSALTGISTDPFPYTGSAVISDSLEVVGDVTGSKFIFKTADYNYLNARIRLRDYNTGISITSHDEVHFLGQNVSLMGMKNASGIPQIRLKSNAIFGFTSANTNGTPQVNLNRLDSNTIRVGTGGQLGNHSGSLLLTNLTAAGYVSASTYYGDGSNLTGISSDPFPYTGSAIITGSLEVMGTQRSLYTTQSFQYDGSNLTQITMSFENGTEEITNITYDGSNIDAIVITGSDGINKTYTLSYDGSGNVTNIIVS